MIYIDPNTGYREERKRKQNQGQNQQNMLDAYDKYKKFSEQKTSTGSSSIGGGYGGVPSYAAGTPEEFAAYDAAATDQAANASWLDGLFGGSGGGTTSGTVGGGTTVGTSGGAGGAGAEGAAGGGAAVAAYVVAAIIGQMMATSATDTEFEGQETGNFFSFSEDPNEMNTRDMEGNWRPRVFTEPWLAWGHDQLGWEPTQGEKMDAAVQNEDWGTALKRLPAAADYWADPIRNWIGFDTWKNIAGDELAWLIDPIGGALQSIEDLF